MAKQALYRKYRPKKFEDVRGQDHIVEVLRGSIDADGFSHAYLFSGTRGTGKTSIARILAREIGAKDVDIYEIDAASNRGIDDIRELREAVRALPFESPYKVYIVDEVHMLTKEAFNALLKTLEEPPEHAVFVLATTEMEKLPDTVVSRCEVHHFKKPSQKELQSMVEDVAKSESYKLEAGVSALMALLGEGSFRDTQGVLQKVMSSVEEKKITTEDVERITGAPRSTILNDILSGIDKKDIDATLSGVSEAGESNVDMNIFLDILLQRIRYILLLRHTTNMVDDIKEELPEEDFKVLQKIAKNKESAVRSEVLTALLEARGKIGYASIKQLPIELALLDTIGDNGERQA